MATKNESPLPIQSSSLLTLAPENQWGFPDVTSANQNGTWSRAWDSAFENARDKTGVPFALLKAHAIRESALDTRAFRQEPSGKASYGLMQVLWWKDSARFEDWGITDDMIGDGSLLFDPNTSAFLGAMVIKDNLSRLSLRDSINAYNTGVAENVRVAPGNYTDMVIANYSKLVGRTVS